MSRLFQTEGYNGISVYLPSMPHLFRMHGKHQTGHPDGSPFLCHHTHLPVFLFFSVFFLRAWRIFSFYVSHFQSLVPNCQSSAIFDMPRTAGIPRTLPWLHRVWDMIRTDCPWTVCMHESVRPSRRGIWFHSMGFPMETEKVPFCITCSLLVYMIQNRGKNAFAVVRVVSVGAARVDIAEIVAVVVVRAAEPPPQWNTQTSVFKRNFPCRLQRNRRMPVSPPVQAVHNRDGARIWFWYGLSTVCFSIHFPPCLFVSFRGLAVCYCPIHCIFFLS